MNYSLIIIFTAILGDDPMNHSPRSKRGDIYPHAPGLTPVLKVNNTIGNLENINIYLNISALGTIVLVKWVK